MVEDSSDNRQLLKLILGRAGVRVDVATNGLEGVKKASSEDYNVVLMDVQVPVMDGHSATKELRKKGYDRPIIALTAHAMLEDRTAALRAGCDDYLSKPINSIEMFNTLEQWIVTGHHHT
jgi:CheY-like chemotaxis protein